MTSHGQCPRGGACECPRGGGCFSIFRRADDVTRTMSKGGCACECPRVGAFADNVQGGGAPGVPPIQVQTPPPPPTWLAGYGPA